MAEDVREPYSTDVREVGAPSYNATTHEPSKTNIMGVSWDNVTFGFSFTVPAGEWETAGWLADSGWDTYIGSGYPDNLTFTIWDSFTVENTRTFQIPKVYFYGEAFSGGMLPNLGVDLAELQDMFTGAPRVVRWTLIVLPMAFVLTLTKIGIDIVEAVT